VGHWHPASTRRRSQMYRSLNQRGWAQTTKNNAANRGQGSDKTRDFCSRNLSHDSACPQQQASCPGEEGRKRYYCSRLFHRCSATGNRLLENAGLEVLQVLTSQRLLRQPMTCARMKPEQVLVYDLGWHSTMSRFEITGEVTEVLASHGNNQLGR